MILYGALVMLVTQLNLVLAGCKILPDESGHVDIPGSWESIDEKAFAQCCNENDFIMSPLSHQTSLCMGRKFLSLTIPDSVNIIGDEAFLGCDTLISVSFGNILPLSERMLSVGAVI